MMTLKNKLSMLKTMLEITDDSKDQELKVYLDFAKNEILGWLYHLIGEVPEYVVDVPNQHEQVQIMACVVGINGKGAENETAHNENGINRTFKYVDAIDYIRSNVMPYIKVV